MAGRKKWMSVHTALMMITTTLLAATVSMADDNAVAPAEKSQLNTWFDNNVKPYAQQKSTLDPALVKAEDGAKVVKVMQDGKGDYKKITDAINSIPAGNTKRVIVYIGGGVYTEKITIPRNKPFVTLYGEPKNMPNLTYSGTAAQYGTVNSATLVVESDYFTAVNLVIKVIFFSGAYILLLCMFKIMFLVRAMRCVMVFVEFFTKAGWEKSGGAGCSIEGVRDQGCVVQLQNDWISGHHL